MAQMWDMSCRDWRERLLAGRSLVPDLPLLDQVKAQRAIQIFDRLRLPDVPGKPQLSEAAGDWFREIVGALHGSLMDSGERMIREVFTLVPKKNSKTSYGAALMVTSLLVNLRPNAEFLLVAPTQQIAELAFAQAAGMIEADPFLADPSRSHVQYHLKKITWLATGATLQVKSFDPKVLTGVKPAGILMDELHAVSGNANADRVVGQMRGGLVSQAEGFLVFITTQSERPPAGVFRAELMKARAVRDGTAKGAVLPVLYEFPDAVDWKDQKNWWMVTPNRGRSISIDRLVEDFEGAQATGPEEIARWASQHLNIEIGLALASDRWAGADYWLQQAEQGLSLETLLERSEVVVVGIDGGGLDDLLSLAVLGRDARNPRRWMMWSKSWAHTSVLERRKQEAGRLRDFERCSDLTIVQHLGTDIDELVDICQQVDQTGKLAYVGLDPFGVGAIVDALAEVGIGSEDDPERSRVVAVSQGYQLQGAIKAAERKLADGSLVHCGQPIMAWAVGNAKVEPKGNAITITKQAAGSAKIDPLMALFDAVSLMSRNPAAPGVEPQIIVL